MLAHMPLLITLSPMPKCRKLLANLLVRCCVANATAAAVAQAADACDDAMFANFIFSPYNFTIYL
jgi:hypothetical protein